MEWKFEKDAMDSIKAGFHPRQLHQTRYAERLIRVGIAPICDREPKFVRAQWTARLRDHYGVRKSRANHRHHAADALMVALAPKHFEKQPLYCNDPEFRELLYQAINGAVISHRISRSPSGALHNERAEKKQVITGEKKARNVLVFDRGQSNPTAYLSKRNWAMEIFEMPPNSPNAGAWVV